ncbi:hypothetical protein MWU63_13375 [Pseudohalocynthiibacter sp. F2068]|nr:hypothetical protein [Pseudohalocynthiibacter sp. F2068]
MLLRFLASFELRPRSRSRLFRPHRARASFKFRIADAAVPARFPHTMYRLMFLQIANRLFLNEP